MSANSQFLTDDEFKKLLARLKLKAEREAQETADAKFAQEFAAKLNGHLKKEYKADVEQKALEDDAALAKRLQAELNGEQKKRTETAETDNDAVIAKLLSEQKFDVPNTTTTQTQLQNDELLAHISQDVKPETEAAFLAQYKKTADQRRKLSKEQVEKIEKTLLEILQSPAVAGEATNQLTDAHKYTRTLIRAGIPVLQNIDDQFKLSTDSLAPTLVLKEVLEMIEKMPKEVKELSRISVDAINATFQRIAGAPALEAQETNANAHHLLSRSWTLGKSMGMEYQTAVATCLSDNITDKGGCIPGLIARLYAVYARMMGIMLGVSAKIEKKESPKKA